MFKSRKAAARSTNAAKARGLSAGRIEFSLQILHLDYLDSARHKLWICRGYGAMAAWLSEGRAIGGPSQLDSKLRYFRFYPLFRGRRILESTRII